MTFKIVDLPTPSGHYVDLRTRDVIVKNDLVTTVLRVLIICNKLSHCLPLPLFAVATTQAQFIPRAAQRPAPRQLVHR